MKGPTSEGAPPHHEILIGAADYKEAYSVEKCSGCLEPSQPIRTIKAKATKQPSQVPPPKLNSAEACGKKAKDDSRQFVSISTCFFYNNSNFSCCVKQGKYKTKPNT